MQLRDGHRRILAHLAGAGPSSRADLAAALRLPKATLAGLLAELAARGLVTEGDAAPRPAAPGRPARLVALVGAASAVGVLHAGAGRVRARVVSSTGEVLAAADRPLERTTPQPEAVAAAGAALGEAADGWGHHPTDLTAVVFGVSSPVPRRRRPATGSASRRWEWIPTWLDDGLADALRGRLGVATLVENDANLGALGEHRFGVAREHTDVVYVKLGERSLGAGLILGGRLVRGATGYAGELAHVQVRPDGPVCACGGRGCLLATITTELLELSQPTYDEPLTFGTVLRLAAAGDIGLQRMLADLGRAVGRPLADLCTLLNPDAFVIDGAVGRAGAHIARGLAETIDRHASPSVSAAATVLVGGLGDRAETLGAVALAAQAGTPA